MIPLRSPYGTSYVSSTVPHGDRALERQRGLFARRGMRRRRHALGRCCSHRYVCVHCAGFFEMAWTTRKPNGYGTMLMQILVQKSWNFNICCPLIMKFHTFWSINHEFSRFRVKRPLIFMIFGPEILKMFDFWSKIWNFMILLTRNHENS